MNKVDSHFKSFWFNKIFQPIRGISIRPRENEYIIKSCLAKLEDEKYDCKKFKFLRYELSDIEGNELVAIVTFVITKINTISFYVEFNVLEKEIKKIHPIYLINNVYVSSNTCKGILEAKYNNG